MSPPLPPSQLGTSFFPGADDNKTKSRPRCKIEIECFLDLICPFSARMFNTLYEGVIPALAQESDVEIILHQVIQPWHPQGTMIHEAALACKAVAPEAYLPYVHALYKAFQEGKFADSVTWNKTRAEIYNDCLQVLPTAVAEAAVAVDANKVQDLLQRNENGSGTAMTQAVKWACKFHRTRGVHVTPTVFVNGLEASAVSSGWTKDEWLQFLEKKGDDFFQV